MLKIMLDHVGEVGDLGGQLLYRIRRCLKIMLGHVETYVDTEFGGV